MAEQNLLSLSICSRCIVHEIRSWILDKRGEINPESIQQISDELKLIKLGPGKCIVCNNKFIAENTIENIIKIMEKNKAPESIKKEFKNLFCINI